MRYCAGGDDSEAKSIAEMDPEFYNKQDEEGITALMHCLNHGRYSLTWWLLSMSQEAERLDTSLSDVDGMTVLHKACWYLTPLDIVIGLLRLSSLSTIKMKNKRGKTMVDYALAFRPPSARTALYLYWLEGRVVRLSWFGAVPVYQEQERITLRTWIQKGYLQDAMFWAVAANVR